MQSKKIEDVEIQQGGDMAQIAMAVAKQQKNNTMVLNKDLLPSKGKFYPNDLYIKKLSTIDIKNLSVLTADTLDGALNNILAHNIQGVNVNDILVGDKFWLIFYLRNLTYNDYPFSVKVKCDECNKTFMYKTQQKDFVVKYIPEDVKHEYTMDNGDTIEWEYPTIGIEIQSNQIRKDPERYTIDGVIDGQMLNVACYIKSINKQKVSIMKAYDYICNLDPISFSNFGNYTADIDFGVSPYFEIECDCNNKVAVPISLSPEYFMPKIQQPNK